MVAIGMRPHVVRRVLAEHGVERCRKQLAWLPHRPAVERPEAYLYCAIVDDFPEPRSYAAARAARIERERAAVAAKRERDDRARRLADEAQAEQQRHECARYLESLSPRDRDKLHALASADVIACGTRDGHPLFNLQVRCAVNARLSAIVRERSRSTRAPDHQHSLSGDLL